MSEKLTAGIEISFPVGVDISRENQIRLDEVVTAICRDYEATHPGRIMWPAGFGDRITFMPMTAEEEQTRGIEFDSSVLAIDVAEREAYPGERNSVPEKKQ